MARRLTTIVLIIVVATAAAGVYRVVQSRLAVDVYRQRLQEVGQAYEQLAQTYNSVVSKTAVTELLVQDGKLCVIVRNAAGVIKTINTPFDPTGEIYVDYIVTDGRLWIRRVYDNKTPPIEGMVIDPKLAQIDWQAAPTAVGKAVYRHLTGGRWIVTVTGDGSLGLAQVNGEVELASPPPVKDYEQLQTQLDHDLNRIGPGDVLRKIIAPGGWHRGTP